MNTVIQTTNHIKSNALCERLFKELCIKELCKHNEESYNQLLFHTKVQWLSRRNYLRRVVELWDSITSFFAKHELGSELCKAKKDIYFMSDIFEKLTFLFRNSKVNVPISYRQRKLSSHSYLNSLCISKIWRKRYLSISPRLISYQT
ncbi:hypothetical protein GJ496_011893 [Pomphorhynchus laevis]|nr:hypothetical protein GJ496_005146 [Pomphorhynchus laevis]KAI0989679.1 hypothetical protein GJ496_011893 [Pomphorhynchus laevis]